VVEALDEYADEIDAEALAPALNDPSPEVRFEALGIVGDMDDENQVRETARRFLNDPDDEVRSLAEGILDMEDG
jgi:HEAT repeat protein